MTAQSNQITHILKALGLTIADIVIHEEPCEIYIDNLYYADGDAAAAILKRATLRARELKLPTKLAVVLILHIDGQL